MISTNQHDALPETIESQQAANHLLVFHVGDQAYALSLSALAEILPMTELSSPPRAPRILAGLLTIGCDTIPVVRLDRLFGLPDMTWQLYTPLLVLRRKLALAVDRVSRIVVIDPDDLAPIEHHHSLNGTAVGVLHLDDAMVLVLDERRLLLAEEERRLEELRRTEQERMAEAAGEVA